MYLLIICLPLLSTMISGLFGQTLGAFGAMRITVISMALTCFLSCVAFYEVALAGTPCYIELFNWFDSELITFSWGFLFDTLTVVMLVVVTSISTCVHLYSTEYMANDPHIQRFMAYLSLFTFFMIILVTADNFFQMFLGWEGVGLCSYLLVNFWYGRLQANKAALKAMIVNRIGDIGFAIGIFIIYYAFKSIDYSTVFALAPTLQKQSINFFGFEFNLLSLVCFFFFIAATGKSAQIGLHTWLPDAMEGPTPVSALIHAATMVTAGVFLIVRCSPLFEYAPMISIIITVSGAMTAFMAASIGLVQNDLKRVIAYSTCSQLGYMMIACGTSGYSVGMFHLTNHAFFKALLFLSAGAIIHAVNDEQDVRKMGGILFFLPFTYSMMLIGSFSLMGFPFLTGFYSKDLILEWTFSQFSINGLFAYWMGSISAFFTAFYSLRVICLTFLRKPSISLKVVSHVHEAPFKMAFPLFILSIFSIFVGYFLKDMFVGVGTDFWGNSIFVLPQNLLLLEAEFLNTSIKIFPVCLSLLGATSAFVLYNFFFKLIYQFKLSFIGRHLYIFFNRKWFFDKIYNYVFANHILVWGYRHAYQNIDRGLIEFLGPTGIWLFINNQSTFINTFLNQNVFTINRLRIMFKSINILLWGVFFLSFYALYFTQNLGFLETFFTKNLILESFLIDDASSKTDIENDAYKFFNNHKIFFIQEAFLQEFYLQRLHDLWYNLFSKNLEYNAYLNYTTPLNKMQNIYVFPKDLALWKMGSTFGITPYPLWKTISGDSCVNELILLPNFIQDFLGTTISKTEFLKTIKTPSGLRLDLEKSWIYGEEHSKFLQDLKNVLNENLSSIRKTRPFSLENLELLFNIQKFPCISGYNLTNLKYSFDLEIELSVDDFIFDKKSKIFFYKEPSFENYLKNFLNKDFLNLDVEFFNNNAKQNMLSQEIMVVLTKMLFEGHSFGGCPIE